MTIMESTVNNCDKNIAAPGGGDDDSKGDRMEPAEVSSSRLSAPAPAPTPTQSSTNQDLVNTSNQIDVISLLPQSNAAAAAASTSRHHQLITRTDHNRTDETSSESSGSICSSQEGADLLAAASSGPDVNNQATDQRISAAAPEVDNHLDTVQLTPLPSTSSGAGHQRREQQQQQQPNQGQQWLAQVASQTQQGVRQRMSQASDQLGVSLRQMYASASSITNAAAAAAAAGGVAVGAAVVVDVPPSYHNIPGIVPYYHGRSIGPPPSYDDVINPYAPPPSYQSLFGQFREARKTSRGLLDLLRRLAIILASTLGCTLLIAFMILIPFTMIIIGAIYIDECKIEHIPAFLLVGGLVWASKNIVHCYGQCRKVERQEQSDALAAELYLNSTSASFTTTTGSSSPSPSASLRLPPLLASSTDLQFNSCTNTTITTTIATRDCATLMTPTRTFGHANDDDDSADADEDILRGDLHLAPSSSSSSAAVLQSHNNATIHATRGNQSHNRARHHQHRDEQHRNRYSSEQQQQRGLNSTSRLKSSICESLLNCVLFGWFIAGCVIVFRNYEPDFDNQASARYCHRTVYMYTFWLITSAILSFGLFISCICCLMVSSALASRQSDIGLA